MGTYDQWLAYYTERFGRISNDALKGYWWIYGREAEETTPPRALAAWAAVNAEMARRKL